MVTVEDILKHIITKRQEHMEAALSAPPGKSEFDYGRAVGMFTGFRSLEIDIARMLEDDARGDFEEDRRK